MVLFAGQGALDFFSIATAEGYLGILKNNYQN